MGPIVYSKSQTMPTAINNIIFDFAGWKHFYAINWVCRNWQKDLLEEKVLKIATDLFDRFILDENLMAIESLNCLRKLDCSHGLLLDAKSKKNGVLKILSLPLIRLLDIYECENHKHLQNKFWIAYEDHFCFYPGRPSNYNYSFTYVFYHNNKRLHFDLSKRFFSVYNLVGDQYIFMGSRFLDINTLKEKTHEIGRLINPYNCNSEPINCNSESITSFKDFFAFRVFRKQDAALN